VHLWRACLSWDADVVAAVSGLLSDDERAEASRGLEPVRRARVLGRGLLRVALSCHLGISPASVCFAYDASGKPALASGSGLGAALSFSVARSADCCLVAIAGADVGVDVERLELWPDLDGLAERYFAAEEVAAMRVLEGEAKARTFLRLWTCKEALVKGLGGGLAGRRLERLVVRLDEEAPVLASSEETDVRSWKLAVVPIEEPWVASVALRVPEGGEASAIRFRVFSHDFPVALAGVGLEAPEGRGG
jgi:4'-phosphopantetheinyl transferase